MARIKPEERVLSYHEKGKCFFKFYRGKRHYLPPRQVAKSNDAAYREALENWKRLKAGIDAGAAVGPAVDAGDASQAAVDRAIAAAFPLPDFLNPDMIAAMNVSAAMAAIPTAATRSGGKIETVSELVAAFIASKRALADAGEISRQMFTEYKANVRVFGEWAEGYKILRVDQITASVLDKYKEFTLRLKSPEFARTAECNQLGDVAIHKRLARVKQLIDYAWSGHHLENLPRNLKSFAKMRGKANDSHKPDSDLFWTVEECREMFRNATPRTKLYLLLACNIGATQAEIASLRHNHVDFSTGIVARPRNKTGTKSVHRLWKITADLLKAEMTVPDRKGSNLMLVGAKGNPLISDSQSTDTRNDTIRLAWNMLRRTMVLTHLRETQPELFALAKRPASTATPAELEAIEQAKQVRASRIKAAVRQELQNEKRSYKSLRKTSANLLEKQFGDGSKIADSFLSHTQKSTKKFYVTSHHEKLFEALTWLESVYDFQSVT